MDYSAAALGERELAAGTEVRDLLRRSGVTLLAANLPRRTLKEWGAEATRVVRFPGFSVGIIGMAGALKTDFRKGYSPRLPGPLTADSKDYAKTLGQHLKKLAKSCDVVVVLTQADLGKATELARDFPEIDVLISATDAYFGLEPLLAGNTVLLFTGKEGQRAGRVRLKVFPNRTVGVIEGRLVRLGEDVAEDADTRKLVRESIRGVNEWHRQRARAARPETAAGESPYRGSQACKSCHAEAYRVWKESAHSHAMQVLEDVQQDFLPQCVSCHVTGWERPGGFRNRIATPELADVQCEACHGPGARHLEDTSQGYQAVGLESCAATCHTPEQTGGHFKAESNWEKIRH